MQIAYIDGPRLRTAILAGSRAIIINTEELNAINVFPVPDGDTGTNLASTMRSIVTSLSRTLPKDAGSVLRYAARSALEGARGNSGAIFAQFLQSLAHELGSEARIGAKRFAQGAVTAAEMTKAALASPREGTILTVLHDWALALRNRAAHSDDIFQVFHSGLEAAKASLERTRNMLPEMRRAGVVDAGAKGFVHLLDGIAELLGPGQGFRQWIAARRASRLLAAISSPQGDTMSANAAFADMGETDGPRYCTEALVHESKIALASVRERLSEFGNSVVVAGDEDIARIHLHCDLPSAVFDFLDSAGSVEQHKVDDMELQRKLAHRSASRGQKRPCLIVVDTGCDLPAAYMLEHCIVKVQALITIEGITRPDGPALNLGAIHSRMALEPDFSMSTSQPPESSFTRAFSLALAQADEALYIGLSSALSGTFQAGKKAAEGFGGKVRCFDSKSVTAGAGILTAFAVGRAEAGASAEEILAALEEKRKELELFVAVKDLSSLIRSGRLHGIKSLVLRKFGLKPLLGTDKIGKAMSRGIYYGEKNTVPSLFARIRSLVPRGGAWDIHIVHVAAKDEANRLAELLRARVSSGAAVMVSDMGPLLASIGWLGALGVAALPRG